MVEMSKKMFAVGIVITIIISVIASAVIAIVLLENFNEPVNKFGPPDYNSGWKNLEVKHMTEGVWINFTHNLGCEENLFVYILGRSYVDNEYTYFQDATGVTWKTLDKSTIAVMGLNPQYTLSNSQVKVSIWVME